MKYPKIPLAQTIIQLCKAKKIEHIIISPGSRSAPLTIGFTNDSFFKCYSIVDERCAAFFALGIAQQLKQPTALVCTSGSALLNYYPAIAEAFYSDIPLVVLSADRPKHLINIGDGQTINQEHVFENHILYSANLKQDLKQEHGFRESDEPAIIKNLENKLEKFLGLQLNIQKQNELEINKALNTSLLKKGPVHINIPFDEPLYEMVEELSVKPKIEEVVVTSKKMDDGLLNDLVAQWYDSKKKMVLVGVNAPNSIEKKWLEELAKDESVIVFTETTSNLHHSDFFPSIDKIIAPLTDEEFKKLQPEILLTFGGLIVSKKIKAFLRKFKPNNHWHIDERKANDTFFCLDHHIKTSPNQFFSDFFERVTHTTKSDYQDYWKGVKKHRRKKHELYLETIPFSDLKAYDSILNMLPRDSILQLANSAAVRYAQLFKINKSIEVYCNRGTSGIDGSSSTAIGSASATEKQTVLVTGDLSFFYDSNALWNDYIPSSFRIILINNGGGGIFRILPGQKDTENFDKFFETKHKLNAENICKMFDFEYITTNSVDSLSENLTTFFQASETPKLIEIFTPSTVNDKVLLEYFNYIK